MQRGQGAVQRVTNEMVLGAGLQIPGPQAHGKKRFRESLDHFPQHFHRREFSAFLMGIALAGMAPLFTLFPQARDQWFQVPINRAHDALSLRVPIPP